MAIVNPVNSSMQLVLSLGLDANGKEITKSVSVPKIDINADANKLLAVSEALGSLLAYPVAVTKKNSTGVIVE